MAPNSARYLTSLRLEPCTGTGRFLFESSILNPDLPLVLFGIEVNFTIYRAGLVNMALFSKHPYTIVCADALMLDAPVSSPVWSLGNRWIQPDITEFYFKPPPIRKDAFSLKAFVDLPVQEPILQEVNISPKPAFSLKKFVKEQS